MTHKRMLEVDIDVLTKTYVDLWAAINTLQVLSAAAGDEKETDLPVRGVVDHVVSILKPIALHMKPELPNCESVGGCNGDA